MNAENMLPYLLTISRSDCEKSRGILVNTMDILMTMFMDWYQSKKDAILFLMNIDIIAS